MLRILSLNYEYPPIGGGGGNAHQQILKELSLFPDLHVTLLTTTMRKELECEEISSHVRIIRLPIEKKELLYWRRSEVIRYLLMHYGFLKQHLKQYTYDLCHVFFGFPSGMLAYLFRKHFPYIVSVRGSDVPGYNKRFSLDYYFLKPLLNRVYSSAASVIANSQGLQTLFESQFPSLPAGVIPNGVDTKGFAPISRIPRSTISLITVARLIPRKGIDLLIQACQELERRNIDFTLHIVGDGPEEDTLKKLSSTLGLSGHVQFHGRMERGQLAQLLPRCDLFVLPSHAEGMSNAALEAMACGLPLVLTDTGGSKELIDGNGEIVPTGDQGALTTTLLQFLSYPDELKTMGLQSRALAEQFSWKRAAVQYRDLYYKTIEEKLNLGNL